MKTTSPGPDLRSFCKTMPGGGVKRDVPCRRAWPFNRGEAVTVDPRQKRSNCTVTCWRTVALYTGHTRTTARRGVVFDSSGSPMPSKL